jgi:hypothetical protein
MRKEPNQSAGFQVGLNEQCARKGDAEAGGSRREQDRLLAVPRSVTSVAVLQSDRFEPQGPRLPLVMEKRHFEEMAG